MKQTSKTIDASLFTDFTRFYVLLLLFEGGEHGYSIMQSLNGRLGRRVSPSLVYPFLRLLEDDGYVRVETQHSGPKRKKNTYSLTSRGRSLCTDLFRQFTLIVSSAIEPSMQTCAHCGCRVYGEPHMEEVRNRKAAFCCKYCAAAYRKAIVR